MVSSIKTAMVFLLLTLWGCQTTPATSLSDVSQWQTQRQIIINYLNRGLPSKALKELATLKAEQNDNPDYLNLYGLTFLALNNSKQASKVLRRAYSMTPSSTSGLNYSSALIENRQYRKALSVLNKVRKTRGFKQGYAFRERLYHNMGLGFEKLGKKKSALKAYRKAISINPKFYLSQLQYATLLKSTGNKKAALSSYRRAQVLCPNCIEPIMGLSALYVQAANPKYAVTLINQFMSRKDVAAAARTRARSIFRKIATVPSLNIR
jgi:tetratricopeptide (TPR) repeat protein